VRHGWDVKIRISLRRAALIFTAVLALSSVAAFDSPQDRIPAAEFSKIITSFSEEEGYFLSDNLISNEDSYLTILKKMRELRISGGAYIGVGPEQNFTYIAKIRPSIAFLVDIRRQAIIQHLMYKALFHLSKNRAEFLSRLLSRPLTGKDAPGADSSAGKLMEYFSLTPADLKFHDSNLLQIEHAIQSEFEFPLSKEDQDSLAKMSMTFYAESVAITFQFKSPRRGGFGRGGFGMPSLRELIEQQDPDGKLGNFLASAEDYQFLRDLHERNRIIPIVGDFAGTKALKSIAGYLRDHSYKVSVFYTSNVEMYLFQNQSFDDFVNNVKALPITDGSIFIRSANSRGQWAFSSHRMTTMLQYISVFLKDYQDGRYADYWMLTNTHSIPINPEPERGLFPKSPNSK
jgi:hypothetical protein